jgi:hypothetical protein
MFLRVMLKPDKQKESRSECISRSLANHILWKIQDSFRPKNRSECRIRWVPLFFR